MSLLLVVDKSATRSVIIYRYYRRLPDPPVLTHTNWTLTDAQGKDHPMIGQCHLVVTIGNRHFAASFFVVDAEEKRIKIVSTLLAQTFSLKLVWF